MTKYVFFILSLFVFGSCASEEKADPTANQSSEESTASDPSSDDFQWQMEQVADLGILRYKIHGFDKLTLNQKLLVYCLNESGLSGRDIMYDQNYRHNLAIRDALEQVMRLYEGKREGKDWEAFEEYLKRVWFSNGIHHHYSNDKFIPGFSQAFLEKALDQVGVSLSDEIMEVLFNPKIDNKKVSQDPNKDLVKYSAVNFYGPQVSQADVENYYTKIIDKNDKTPISYGLNSRLIKNDKGQLVEEVYAANGKYGKALLPVAQWLDVAEPYSENEAQRAALVKLTNYYMKGDLNMWDDYNIAWTQATEGDIDYISGFVEVYNDPMGYRGSFESIVQIKDFDASARMKKVANEAQWFEDNSPIMDDHKKKDVKGISYNVVTVAGESGDASPSTPIGVNLPNANWIRVDYGSKSVSLGNIIEAYNEASGPGLLTEFSYDEKEIKRAQEYGKLAGKIHTALHEVIGHASGQLEAGVATPKETLKNYASPIEEARADLVSLYFIVDDKMVDMGLMPSIEVGKAAYDQYLKNGYMLQLRRIEPGNNIEQAHMRNRHAVSSWVLEKGVEDGAVAFIVRKGKTYIEIKDYMKLRVHFGTLLREIQRIKSQGDYAAAVKFFETYGVQVNQKIHKEVLARSEKLNIPPYYGFINPEMELVVDDNGTITDVAVTYPTDFSEQMLRYSDRYGYLVGKGTQLRDMGSRAQQVRTHTRDNRKK